MVRELSKHPQVLADVLSLSAASDEARLAAASEEPFDGPGSIPCIEVHRAEAACLVPVEDYEASLVEEMGGALFVFRLASVIVAPTLGCFPARRPKH